MPLVLITSITFEDCTNNQTSDGHSTIGMFASRRKHATDKKNEQYILHAPLIEGQFTGTGDICAALFLAWTAGDSNDELKAALEKLGGTYYFVFNNFHQTR